MFFFAKTVILAIFWHVWPKSAKMRIFIKNHAMLFFTLIVPQPTSCRVSEKSLERFPRSIRYIHPCIRTRVISQNRSLSLVQQVSRMNIERAPFGFRWKFGEEKCLEKKCWEKIFWTHWPHWLATFATLAPFGFRWNFGEKKYGKKIGIKIAGLIVQIGRPHCPDSCYDSMRSKMWQKLRTTC